MSRGIGHNLFRAIKGLLVVAAVGLVSMLAWLGYGIYLLIK